MALIITKNAYTDRFEVNQYVVQIHTYRWKNCDNFHTIWEECHSYKEIEDISTYGKSQLCKHFNIDMCTFIHHFSCFQRIGRIVFSTVISFIVSQSFPFIMLQSYSHRFLKLLSRNEPWRLSSTYNQWYFILLMSCRIRKIKVWYFLSFINLFCVIYPYILNKFTIWPITLP